MSKQRSSSPGRHPGRRLTVWGWSALGLGLLVGGAAIAFHFRERPTPRDTSLPRDIGWTAEIVVLTLGPGIALLLLSAWRRGVAALRQRLARPKRARPPARLRTAWALHLLSLGLLALGVLILTGDIRLNALFPTPLAGVSALLVFALARLSWIRAQLRTFDAPRTSEKKTRKKPAKVQEVEQTSDARWIPPRSACEIAGTTIHDGMLYVGTWLASLADPSKPEPALVRPDLPTNPDAQRVRAPKHAPSYSALPPSSRAAHLEWLAGGRSDPDTELAYVRLFLQGLERRLLHDGEHETLEVQEVTDLCDELRRLRATYDESRAFRAKIEALIDYAELEYLSSIELPAPAPGTPPSRQTPARLRLAIGRAFSKPEALSVEWALAWIEHTNGGKLPAVARRAPDEFAALFRARYSRITAARLAPPSHAHSIAVIYEPISASLAGRHFEARSILPDYSGWSEPLKALGELVDQCVEELGPFARWRARHPQRTPDLAALSTLPGELLRERDDPLLSGLCTSLEAALGDQHAALFPVRGLFIGWPGVGAQDPGRTDCKRLAELIGKLGYGVEPDVRFGGPRMRADEQCALFRLADDAPQSASSGYPAATLISHLALLVSSADGEVDENERSRLDTQLDAALHLEPTERERIDAHRLWLGSRERNLSGLRKRVAGLSSSQRKELGRFVVQIAAADGRVDASEVAMLEKIHRLLELDVQHVHAELHALAVSAHDTAESTWDEEQVEEARGVTLDQELIRAKLRETAQVSEMLSSIFAEEDEQEAPRPSTPAAPEEPRIAGLDAPHSAFLSALCARVQWPRAELEELAEGLGLLPDGALDRLNEVAFERCDAPLWEGEDPIEIDNETAEELTR